MSDLRAVIKCIKALGAGFLVAIGRTVVIANLDTLLPDWIASIATLATARNQNRKKQREGTAYLQSSKPSKQSTPLLTTLFTGQW